MAEIKIHETSERGALLSWRGSDPMWCTWDELDASSGHLVPEPARSKYTNALFRARKLELARQQASTGARIFHYGDYHVRVWTDGALWYTGLFSGDGVKSQGRLLSKTEHMTATAAERTAERRRKGVRDAHSDWLRGANRRWRLAKQAAKRAT